MRNALKYLVLTATAWTALSTPIIAQDTNSEVNPDPVYVFNRTCYAQVPNVEAIRTMATKLAWRAMNNDELEEFKNSDNPTSLDGWDVQVGERLFRVGVTQSGLSPKLTASFPDFANGVATSCSLVLDDQQDGDLLLANMQTLAGKDPISADVPEGLLRTTTWGGGNDDLKVFLFAKVPATGKGGLLNVTILQR